MALEAHGHDVVHWQYLGPRDAPDASLIALAVETGRVILTADLDFGEAVTLLGLTGPSVVQLRTESTNPARISDLVAQMIVQAEPDLMAGAVVTIEPGRTRVRRLPSALPDTDEP